MYEEDGEVREGGRRGYCVGRRDGRACDVEHVGEWLRRRQHHDRGHVHEQRDLVHIDSVQRWCYCAKVDKVRSTFGMLGKR